MSPPAASSLGGRRKAWLNKAWLDKAWLNKAWLDKAWLNKASRRFSSKSSGKRPLAQPATKPSPSLAIAGRQP